MTRSGKPETEALCFLQCIAGCDGDALRLASARSAVPPDALLRRLADACAAPELALEVWRVQDDLSTITHHFSAKARNRALRGDIITMTRIVERAARALLVRADLSAADFEVLYAPFADLVPMSSPRRPGKSSPAE